MVDLKYFLKRFKNKVKTYFKSRSIIEFSTFVEAKNYCETRNKYSLTERINFGFKMFSEFLEKKNSLFDLYGNSLLLYLISFYQKNNNGKCPFLIDFGGGVGQSSVMLHQIFGDEFLKKSSIVELEEYLTESKKFKYSSVLNYSSNLEEVLQKNEIDIFFASGVIQCLEDPLSFLKKLSSYQIPIVAFTRNNFSNKKRILIQKFTFLDIDHFAVNTSLRKEDIIEIFINSGYSVFINSPEQDNSGICGPGNFGGNLVFFRE